MPDGSVEIRDMPFFDFLEYACLGGTLLAMAVFVGLVVILGLRRKRRERENREAEADDEDFEAPDVWK